MSFLSVGPLVGGEPASFCFLGGCGKKEPFPRPWKRRKSEHTLPCPQPCGIQVAAIWTLSDSAPASFCPCLEEIKQP